MLTGGKDSLAPLRQRELRSIHNNAHLLGLIGNIARRTRAQFNCLLLLGTMCSFGVITLQWQCRDDPWRTSFRNNVWRMRARPMLTEYLVGFDGLRIFPFCVFNIDGYCWRTAMNSYSDCQKTRSQQTRFAIYSAVFTGIGNRWGQVSDFGTSLVKHCATNARPRGEFL
jgi:hypothetical protein